jgi:hypothetical protein
VVDAIVVLVIPEFVGQFIGRLRPQTTPFGERFPNPDRSGHRQPDRRGASKVGDEWRPTDSGVLAGMKLCQFGLYGSDKHQRFELLA